MCACCRLGRKRRFVCTFEWLTLWPVMGRFPQISQRCDMGCSLELVRFGTRRLTRTRISPAAAKGGKTASPPIGKPPARITQLPRAAYEKHVKGKVKSPD